MESSRHSNERNLRLKIEPEFLQRQKQGSVLRTTIADSDMCNSVGIARLRNSFSVHSVKYFDQIEPKTPVRAQQKRHTFQNLKSTLDSIHKSISSAKFCMSDSRKSNALQSQKSLVKTPVSAKSGQKGNFFSKQTPNEHESLQISQFIESDPHPKEDLKIFSLSGPSRSQKGSLYYISECVRACNERNSLAVEHINASIRMINSCSKYYPQEIDPNLIQHLPRKSSSAEKKTLVLDLDETLIHCYEDLGRETDMQVSMSIEGMDVTVGVNIRFHALSFLKRMAKHFQIVIFTASHQSYADAILDELDPENCIFEHRLYRQHCHVLPNELHVKDLRILNRDLRNVVLIDNAAYSYAFQIDNGIPILPFYQGKDNELTGLEAYLKKMADASDVRSFNRQYFQLRQYPTFASAEELIEALYFPKVSTSSNKWFEM